MDCVREIKDYFWFRKIPKFWWKGSIYKLLWPNLLLYSFLYFSLSAYYRFILRPEDRGWFERLSIHCQTYGNLIPVSFVLGFYVSLVIKRWWDQYVSIPWPDNLALFVSALVYGQDERGRLMRRTVMRYVNLSLVLTLRMVSPRVKMRFPTMEHLVEAGFLQPTEMKIFEDLDLKTNHPKYWMPLVWASGVLTRARKENRVSNDFSLKTLIDELNIFRSGCGKLLSYDWISIPLVYTQVVTLAVHFYFLATLMGNQYLDVGKGYPKHQIDLVVPIFTFLEFFFYMGWLKVAESLVNPFGEDDDDFEVMWLIDRNLQMSYVIVDEMHQEHPEMLRDAYWDEVFPAELPYTAATKQFQTEPPQGSTKNVEVPVHMSDFVKESAQLEGEGEDSEEKVGASVGSTNPLRIRCGRGSNASVLSVLTRAFHREDSSKDLEASGRSSGVSLQSRAGAGAAAGAGAGTGQGAVAGGGAGAGAGAGAVASAVQHRERERERERRSTARNLTVYSSPSRASSRACSPSRGSSRITLVGNEFQDELFHLSDISLAPPAPAPAPAPGPAPSGAPNPGPTTPSRGHDSGVEMEVIPEGAAGSSPEIPSARGNDSEFPEQVFVPDSVRGEGGGGGAGEGETEEVAGAEEVFLLCSGTWPTFMDVPTTGKVPSEVVTILAPSQSSDPAVCAPPGSGAPNGGRGARREGEGEGEGEVGVPPPPTPGIAPAPGGSSTSKHLQVSVAVSPEAYSTASGDQHELSHEVAVVPASAGQDPAAAAAGPGFVDSFNSSSNSPGPGPGPGTSMGLGPTPAEVGGISRRVAAAGRDFAQLEPILEHGEEREHAPDAPEPDPATPQGSPGPSGTAADPAGAALPHYPAAPAVVPLVSCEPDV